MSNLLLGVDLGTAIIKACIREILNHVLKIVYYSRFHTQDKLRDLCDHLREKRMFTLIIKIYEVKNYYIRGPKIMRKMARALS